MQDVLTWDEGCLRQGEELTLDYRAETESEKEPRHAICLCGAAGCRGSFLYHTNTANTPQQQVWPSVRPSPLPLPPPCNGIAVNVGIGPKTSSV